MTPEYFQFSAHGPAIRLLFRSRSLLTTDSIDAVVVVVHFADLISIIVNASYYRAILYDRTAFDSMYSMRDKWTRKVEKTRDVARYES